MIKRIPWALLVFRALAAPALVLGAFVGVSGGMLATLVTCSFLSDVFDGIIARRLGVATDALRLGGQRRGQTVNAKGATP